ncbi:hypothetical protein [Paracoccus sp. pheM1]|uniref:hypothetical protein n=1 Tax=Paracoccus sp. pheM1 TaxID=2831675 RepID=UPI001BDB7294|nr:hypothetical protein [Paracoccus sp. pheM1]MBT0779531.1 hypothetical protein [Paracoccus sp. pheM1]
MTEHRWTRRRTWPNSHHRGSEDHWSVYRDGEMVGRIYPHHTPDNRWYWCVFTIAGGTGLVPSMADALEAARQAAGDLPLKEEYGPDPPGRRGLRR